MKTIVLSLSVSVIYLMKKTVGFDLRNSRKKDGTW